jgi:hypothetical protein
MFDTEQNNYEPCFLANTVCRRNFSRVIRRAGPDDERRYFQNEQCGRSLLAFSFVVRRQRRNVGLLRLVFFAAVPRFAGRVFNDCVFNDRQGGSVGWLRRVADSGLFPNRIPTRIMFHAATRTVRVTRKLRAHHFGSIVVHGICSLARGSVTSAFTREHHRSNSL